MKIWRGWWAIGLLGCGGGNSPMPLEPGREWEYEVTTRPHRYLATVKVGRPIAVAGARGYELESPMGPTRLAWKDGVLYCSHTANAAFQPALPLLDLGRERREWRGSVRFGGRTQRVAATVERSKPRTETVEGVSMRVTVSTVKMLWDGKPMTLETWFRNGTGIVYQSQHHGIELVSRSVLVP